MPKRNKTGLTPRSSKQTLIPVKKGSHLFFRKGAIHEDQVRLSTENQYISKISKAESLGLTFPCNEIQVIRFIEQIVEEQSYSSLNGYVAAFKWFHAMIGSPYLEYTPLLDKTMKAIRNKKIEAGDKPNRAEEFTFDDLENACAMLDEKGDLISKRNKVILLLMYFGSMRRNELTSLDVGDVRFVPDGCKVSFKVTKNNLDSVLLPYFFERPDLCPVMNLQSYFNEHWQDAELDEPIFRSCHSSGTAFKKGRLTDNAVSDMLKAVMKMVGSPAYEFYSGHSPRRGLVTDSVRDEVHPIDIANNARMSISTVQIYAKVVGNKSATTIMRKRGKPKTP